MGENDLRKLKERARRRRYEFDPEFGGGGVSSTLDRAVRKAPECGGAHENAEAPTSRYETPRTDNGGMRAPADDVAEQGWGWIPRKDLPKYYTELEIWCRDSFLTDDDRYAEDMRRSRGKRREEAAQDYASLRAADGGTKKDPGLFARFVSFIALLVLAFSQPSPGNEPLK